MGAKKNRAIYQLHIRLRDIEPAIWRRIQVWEDTRLPQLHRVYDYGDEWQHEIQLEAILLPGAGTFYPRCVAGERNGPPEDAGGAWG